MHSISPSNSVGGLNRAAGAFLRALWPDFPSEGWLLIWLKAGKRSHWFPSGVWREAATAAEVHAEQTDVYFGCGLSPTTNGPRRRCEAEEITAIPGLWADVDIRGEAHKKDNLPPNDAAALSLVHEMPHPPSLIVHTGHGVQPWWLFERPWIFADDDDRRQAAALLAQWQAHLRQLASERGWKLDNTQDLARVLRLPGTTNHKGEPVSVTVDLSEPVCRYARSTLRDAIPQQRTSPSRKRRLPATATSQDDHALALDALAGLNASRAVDYDSWLDVGMALHSVDSSASMCEEWDRWSRLAPDRSTEGVCLEKWATFDGGGGITIGSLIHWAREDGWIHPAAAEGGSATKTEPAAPAIEPDLAAEQITHAVLETLRSRPSLARTLLELIRGAETEGQ